MQLPNGRLCRLVGWLQRDHVLGSMPSCHVLLEAGLHLPCIAENEESAPDLSLTRQACMHQTRQEPPAGDACLMETRQLPARRSWVCGPALEPRQRLLVHGAATADQQALGQPASLWVEACARLQQLLPESPPGMQGRVSQSQWC